jgi:hypothetical protein
VTLAEAIVQIATRNEDAVIFAKRPWSATTEAMIAPLDDDLRVPAAIKEAGFEYFLEAPLVTEVLEVLGPRPATFDEKLRPTPALC